MDRRLGRQIGDRRDKFSRQSFFLLAMATKTVAAWSAACMSTTVLFQQKEKCYETITVYPWFIVNLHFQFFCPNKEWQI